MHHIARRWPLLALATARRWPLLALAVLPIRDLVYASGGGAPIEIASATVENKSMNQVLTITKWGMAFSGGSAKTIDGSIELTVRGGDFNWSGTFV